MIKRRHSSQGRRLWLVENAPVFIPVSISPFIQNAADTSFPASGSIRSRDNIEIEIRPDDTRQLHAVERRRRNSHRTESAVRIVSKPKGNHLFRRRSPTKPHDGMKRLKARLTNLSYRARQKRRPSASNPKKLGAPIRPTYAAYSGQSTAHGCKRAISPPCGRRHRSIIEAALAQRQGRSAM